MSTARGAPRRLRYHGRVKFPLQILLTAACLAAIPPAAKAADAAGFVGAEVCAGCHEQEYAAWQGSHHDLAMQKPGADTVLGDFDDARFSYNGVETRFFRRDGRYMVRTDGPDGRLRDFPVAWVFGVYPLQQYLLPLDDGRLQALSIAWDARPPEAGGQRWYHLYPDDTVDHEDPLHWTGPYQNWNTRCAECHSTDLRKNYDGATRSFDTRFVEEDVACEACHGPGAQHVQLAQAENPSSGDAILSLAQRGDWAFPAGEAIARRRVALEGRAQIDSCGRCHARRGTLGDYAYGRPLSDTHRLSLLGQPLYHHDGQILDEVYVYGSFLQSKIQAAGVVCSNCHEPHSNQLRAPGNGVCAQCHRSDRYDAAEHHRHPVDSKGARCVSCHMPDRVYMGVDARRDHSMRIPRPDLSLMTGVPNACNDCHADQDAQWALDALARWDMAPRDTARHPALAMQALHRGDIRGVPRLLELAADSSASPIWRATALEQVAGAGSSEALQLASTLLLSEDPLLRISAVRSLEQLPPPQRLAAIYPLYRDPVAGVRLAVAEALAPVPLEQVGSRRPALEALFEEYERVQGQHLDMPGVQVQLGLFYLARRQPGRAEAAYREALRLNPQLIAARLNLADLLRSTGRDGDAREEILLALALAPGNADALHGLGLLEARAGNRDAALAALQGAAESAQASARHRFVYAVALHDFGLGDEAMRVLRALHRDLPADEQALLALANYSAERREMDAARDYARRLLRLAPDNPGYRQLAQAMGLR
jgi:predicted CXXCH cytochrome family protein